MKKAFKSTSTNTSKFVRRVLSKTSHEKINDESQDMVVESNKNIEQEISALKEQIAILQLTVRSLQDETETKDVALANLAREKESLSSDLRKQKRSNTNLKQQLQDEREYYYKEKEKYCQEMNDCKRIKQQITEVEEEKSECERYKNEIGKLKTALNQTLQANYNLSVKFLRMKNTKMFLKERLKVLEEEHQKAIAELKRQVLDLEATIKEVTTEEFQLPISPSHKKFLKIIKENGNLVHENLCLQLEVDTMSAEMEKLKQKMSRSDIQNNLKYVNSKTKSSSSSVSEKKEKKTVRIDSSATVIQQKTETNIQKNNSAPTDNITKIYERKQTQNIPAVTELQQKESVSLITQKNSSSSSQIAKSTKESLSLMQVSSNSSEMFDCESGNKPVRTHSAPEIQSFEFRDNYSKLLCESVDNKIKHYKYARVENFILR